VVRGLNANTGLDCLVPQGAFYVFPSVASLLGGTSGAGTALQTDQDFVMALLEETGVALVPGSAFGVPGHMRLSYAASKAELEAAVTRIQEFCAGVR
jgi:aspartate aminotransferase